MKYDAGPGDISPNGRKHRDTMGNVGIIPGVFHDTCSCRTIHQIHTRQLKKWAFAFWQSYGDWIGEDTCLQRLKRSERSGGGAGACRPPLPQR
jgi:hypothetical protein